MYLFLFLDSTNDYLQVMYATRMERYENHQRSVNPHPLTRTRHGK